MADIFHEVEEDLRTERYKRLWARYGGVLAGVALAVVIGVGGYVFWKDQSAKRRGAQGEQYAAAMTAIEQGQKDQAMAGFATLAQDSTEGFGFLARLKQVELQLDKGDTAGALTALDALAATSSLEQFYRDYAVYRAALLRLDTEDPQALVGRLQPIIGEANPWRHLARELAALANLKAGKTDEAKKAFQALSDDLAAPAGVRSRAAELLAALGA
ncbi:tetratricopeptide repeat protein [Lacibacterium aquatile]|uniref:Tetratricopeptide repeat protein n=1 Tax=Lacibacterium aquatile TaxID=1168082 RepID=A0ABW5DPN2_9PROT